MNESTCACDKLEGNMTSYSHVLQTFREIAIVKDNGLKIKGKLKDRGMNGNVCWIYMQIIMQEMYTYL